ncbi:MAG: sugar phosphate nucleotidyltransferase [Bradymonadaceae bacterium]
MKGVVLAGGTGSRLFPLTKVTNKHLLPVGKHPMLIHPIFKLRDAGINEILIVTGTEHVGDIVGLLGSGRDLGCQFTYRVQEEAGGIAQALSLAENFAGGKPLCVLLGDNIFQDPITAEVRRFREQPTGAHILVKEVPDPHRYGVACIDGDRITEILEKPKNPPSPLAVTGIYFYDAHVFDIIRRQKRSSRGELEITDVNNDYIHRGLMTFGQIEGWWTDAGTFPSYHYANQLVMGVE